MLPLWGEWAFGDIATKLAGMLDKGVQIDWLPRRDDFVEVGPLMASLLYACAPLSSMIEPEFPRVLTSDNQAGIWLAGITLYFRVQFLPAADLFQLA